MLESTMQIYLDKIDKFVLQYLETIQLPSAAERLKQSMMYSATNGGKRFRPLLALLVGESFEVEHEKILPWATAVELVHTYSLIHDDLPCMDNDDFRRGKPSNHKAFGEPLALLSGDALLTESFYLIAQAYAQEPDLANKLCLLLAETAGTRGMIAGQLLDLTAGERALSFEDLLQVHRLKTAQLIKAPLQGAAIICQLPDDKIEAFRKFGEALGLAFQVADDILDFDEKNQDVRSFTKMIGLKESKSLLIELSDEALFNLKKLNLSTDLLHKMIEYNLLRKR